MGREYQYPHQITVWRKQGDDRSLHNESTYDTFIVKCRYQEAFRLYVNEFGQNVRSRAYVYTMGNDLEMGDIIIEGDFRTESSPVAGAFEVKQRKRLQNQRGDRVSFRYIC